MALARTAQAWPRYRKLKARKAKIEARQARQRREALHVWTTALIRAASSLEIIAPKSIREVTKSAKGDDFKPGAMVRFKAMMNRRALDFAPSEAIQMLIYKAGEAGSACDVRPDLNSPVEVSTALVAAALAARQAKKAKTAETIAANRAARKEVA